MRLIIVGVGKVGVTLVEKLSMEKHDLSIVDRNQEKIDYLINKYDVQGIAGSGSDLNVLEEVSADKADFLIACTSSDELNILCCLLAKKMGTKFTIARVREPEYFDEMEYMRQELGIDMLFNPEYRTAQEIAKVLKFPSAINMDTFAGGMASIVELKITDKNPIVGMSVSQIIQDYGVKVLFGLVVRGNSVFIPKGDFVIQAGDRLHITATETALNAFSRKLHIYKQRAKSVFIIGGGRIAYYLAKELSESGVDVKIIEKDEDRCIQLSEELPKCTILLGDATNQDVLDEEGLGKSDACVTLTGMDEENAIISLYAASKKLDKVVTKVDRPTLTQMVKNLGLETVMSPRNIIATSIVAFVRSTQSGAEGGMVNMYKLHDKVEALEFHVSEDFPYLSVPLKDLKIKQNFLVGGIVRDEEFILPTGNTVLEEGDNVLVITTNKRINDLSQIVRG